MLDDLPEKLFTTKDVANKFSVDRKTVSSWVESGRLVPVMDVGNKSRHSWRFHPNDLEEFYHREKEECRRRLDRKNAIVKKLRGHRRT